MKFRRDEICTRVNQIGKLIYRKGNCNNSLPSLILIRYFFVLFCGTFLYYQLPHQWLDAVLNARENFSNEEIDSDKEGYSQYLKEDLFIDKEAEKIFKKWVEGK